MELKNEANFSAPEIRQGIPAKGKNVGPVNVQGAGIRLGKGAKYLKQSGFACAGSAHN